jgi:hypothetical protein
MGRNEVKGKRADGGDIGPALSGEVLWLVALERAEMFKSACPRGAGHSIRASRTE